MPRSREIEKPETRDEKRAKRLLSAMILDFALDKPG
jgi:hypothetical protein